MRQIRQLNVNDYFEYKNNIYRLTDMGISVAGLENRYIGEHIETKGIIHLVYFTIVEPVKIEYEVVYLDRKVSDGIFRL